MTESSPSSVLDQRLGWIDFVWLGVVLYDPHIRLRSMVPARSAAPTPMCTALNGVNDSGMDD